MKSDISDLGGIGEEILKDTKLENYDLHANIHTIELKSDCLPNIQAEDEKYIKSHNIISNRTNIITSFSVVNPHNYGAGELDQYSFYEDVIFDLTKKVGLDSYCYQRMDIKLDSYIDNYLDNFKLNALIINLFTMLWKFKNDEPTVSYSGSLVKTEFLENIMNEHNNLIPANINHAV